MLVFILYRIYIGEQIVMYNLDGKCTNLKPYDKDKEKIGTSQFLRSYQKTPPLKNMKLVLQSNSNIQKRYDHHNY